MLTEETLLMNINKVDGGNIEVNCKHWHSCAILTNIQTYLDDIDYIDKNEMENGNMIFVKNTTNAKM